MKVRDWQWRYMVHVPGRYQSAKATLVVIAFHGSGGNLQTLVRLSGLKNATSKEAICIVVELKLEGQNAKRERMVPTAVEK